MKSRKFFCVVILAALCSSLLMAQSPRDGVKNTIKQWGQCRSIAFTRYVGNVAVAGRNMAAWANIPDSLARQLLSSANRNDGPYISDIQLTEAGQWVIVGDQIITNVILPGLDNEIKRLASQRERIISVTLNDYGRWIILTDKSYSTSDTDTANWLRNNGSRLGALRVACLTFDNSLVAIFEKGTVYQGNLPQGLAEAINNTNLTISVLKIAPDGVWFFADDSGSYQGWY